MLTTSKIVDVVGLGLSSKSLCRTWREVTSRSCEVGFPSKRPTLLLSFQVSLLPSGYRLYRFYRLQDDISELPKSEWLLDCYSARWKVLMLACLYRYRAVFCGQITREAFLHQVRLFTSHRLPLSSPSKDAVLFCNASSRDSQSALSLSLSLSLFLSLRSFARVF